MQICRKNTFVKTCFVLLSIFCINFSVFSADNSLDSSLLEMPEMPSMPTISVDGSFYTPSLPMEMMPPVYGKDSNKPKENAELTSNDSSGDILSSLLKDNSTLTAGDISNLSDYGLFTDLSTLLGGGITGSSTSSQDLLLQEILKQLNELKQDQKNGSLQQQEHQENIKKDSETFKTRNPSVLRFKINNYDVKDSLVEVFLSKPDYDGSFLFTADRRYVANGKTRTETFYLLFQTIKEAGAHVSYNVNVILDQDYENKNSFIYKMSKIPNLTAEKTGNLVLLKCKDKINIDLLLDIDKQ